MVHFSKCHQRNASEEFDGVFHIFTGEDDPSKMNELDMWNYATHTE